MLTEAEEQRRVAGQEEMPWSAGAMAVGAGGPKGSTGPANGPGADEASLYVQQVFSS